MTKQLVDIGPAMKEIRDTSKTIPRIDPAQIAAALGAEPVPDSQVVAAGPLALLAVRQETARRLHLSSARTASAGTTIPLSDHDWRQLEAIAADLADPGCTPSVGQVAGALLNLALDSVRSDRNAETAKVPITKEQLRARLADAEAKS